MTKFEERKPFAELHLGKAGVEAAETASPELLKHVVEHGFADMHTDDSLDQKSRKVATIGYPAACSAMSVANKVFTEAD